MITHEREQARHEARMREQQLHGWSRAKKEALIRGDIETLKQLSKKKDLLCLTLKKVDTTVNKNGTTNRDYSNRETLFESKRQGSGD